MTWHDTDDVAHDRRNGLHRRSRPDKSCHFEPFTSQPLTTSRYNTMQEHSMKRRLALLCVSRVVLFGLVRCSCVALGVVSQDSLSES